MLKRYLEQYILFQPSYIIWFSRKCLCLFFNYDTWKKSFLYGKWLKPYVQGNTVKLLDAKVSVKRNTRNDGHWPTCSFEMQNHQDVMSSYHCQLVKMKIPSGTNASFVNYLVRSSRKISLHNNARGNVSFWIELKWENTQENTA